MADNTDLPRVLREAREKAKLTQGQLADELNINRWTYVAVEQGRGRVRNIWVRRLPMSIREAVVECLAQQRIDEIAMLRATLHDEPAPPPSRSRRITRPTGSSLDPHAL